MNDKNQLSKISPTGIASSIIPLKKARKHKITKNKDNATAVIWRKNFSQKISDFFLGTESVALFREYHGGKRWSGKLFKNQQWKKGKR